VLPLAGENVDVGAARAGLKPADMGVSGMGGIPILTAYLLYDATEGKVWRGPGLDTAELGIEPGTDMDPGRERDHSDPGLEMPILERSPPDSVLVVPGLSRRKESCSAVSKEGWEESPCCR